MLNGGTPTTGDCCRCTCFEPNVVLEHQHIIVCPACDGLPNLHVRPRYSYFLPRHFYRLVDGKALLKPCIRLDVKLVTNAVCRVDIGSCGDGAAVASIHCRESSSYRGKGNIVGRAEPPEFSDHTPPSTRLPVKVDD
ncbi:hypothetical protein D3C85_1341660 [compost metagenome]